MLDVVRGARWGRVEECISEDPYLVGTTATAYERGVRSTGVVATLKHFVGCSSSRAGRNLAPVHAGPRELEDVLPPPFEMADLGDAGARAGSDVVQVHGHDPVASVTRPISVLLGCSRVDLEAGASAEVAFDVPCGRSALTDRELRRAVEPGPVEVRIGPDAATVELSVVLDVTGGVHPVTTADRRLVRVSVEPAS